MGHMVQAASWAVVSKAVEKVKAENNNLQAEKSAQNFRVVDPIRTLWTDWKSHLHTS